MFAKLGVITMLACAGYGVFGGSDETYTKVVEIPAGKTLYEVTAENASCYDNINDVVRTAMRENGIKNAGNIQPGQKITITLKKV